jgi:hypothetical protein
VHFIRGVTSFLNSGYIKKFLDDFGIAALQTVAMGIVKRIFQKLGIGDPVGRDKTARGRNDGFHASHMS